MNKITVGQRLWFVPNRGECREVEITKVGRKWVHVGEGWQKWKICLPTLESEGNATVQSGNYSVGVCYVDRAAYEARQQLFFDWQGFHRTVYRSGAYSPPKGVTSEDIEQAIKLLKLEPPKC